MKKPATKAKWLRVYNLIDSALSILAGEPPWEKAREHVKQAIDVAKLYTVRAGTREETSAGLAIVEVLTTAWDAKPMYLSGALYAAKRVVAREAALSVVRTTQRRVIAERGRAKSDAAKARRDRAVAYALRNVWDALKGRRS